MKTKAAKLYKFLQNDSDFANERAKYAQKGKDFLLALFRFVIICGISYVILGPLIGMVSRSFFSDADKNNPMVYLIPITPTFERYFLAAVRLDYFNTLFKSVAYVCTLTALQVLVCSMVAYGFARFNFPLKKFFFACVIVMIVIPPHSIMLPLYMTFQSIDLPVFTPAVNALLNNLAPPQASGAPYEGPLNLLRTPWPMYIMTVFGTGLRSGLYIFIFTQFFRGLPKEIEEAAQVDGAGMFRTYFRIMLVNAIPAVVTVAIFSLVWQYNDTFFANLFTIDGAMVLSRRITTLQATVQNADQVRDPAIAALYVNAGVVLVILPLIILYVLLQKQFIEGVERSGIVG
jgi:multiple sugar transport system permease protein